MRFILSSFGWHQTNFHFFNTVHGVKMLVSSSYSLCKLALACSLPLVAVGRTQVLSDFLRLSGCHSAPSIHIAVAAILVTCIHLFQPQFHSSMRILIMSFFLAYMLVFLTIIIFILIIIMTLKKHYIDHIISVCSICHLQTFLFSVLSHLILKVCMRAYFCPCAQNPHSKPFSCAKSIGRGKH